MTLKPFGNDGSDDLNRLRMSICDFGSFKKYFWAKMMNLWMIQDIIFDHMMLLLMLLFVVCCSYFGWLVLVG